MKNGRATPATGVFPATAHWPEILIHPHRDSWQTYARDVWHAAALIRLLLWRNVTLRYKHTIIGAGWAVLQPLLTMLIFTVLFGILIQVPTGGTPYPLFTLSALVAWGYFVHALTLSTKCLVDHRDLLTKVWFPRVILPCVAILEAAVDFLIALALLLVLLLAYGVWPGWSILALPLFFLQLMATVLGAGLWLGTFNVRYRDIINALPFAMQVLLFITPVAYPSYLIPVPWRAVYALNPLLGVVEGFRWALLGTELRGPVSLLISGLSGASLLVSGLWFFRRREDMFADEV
jgi:lipopolysaccharide transport system permease protein